MDLFRHCIVLKPTPLTVRKYARYLAERIMDQRAVDAGTMIDFERVKDLHYTTQGRNARLLHSLALLAEHLWYLGDAKRYIDDTNTMDGVLEGDTERIHIKCSTLSKSPTDAALIRLRELYELPVSALLERLVSDSRAGELMSALRDADGVRFATAYDSTYFETLASAAIVFDMDFPPSIINVIGSVRPLHKLGEIYPPGLEKIADEIKRFERQNVEEKVLVRHSHLTEALFELLKKQRETNSESVAMLDDNELGGRSPVV